MNKVFKRTIYTDLVWLFIGVFGSFYYYSKERYLIFGVFFISWFSLFKKIDSKIYEKPMILDSLSWTMKIRREKVEYYDNRKIEFSLLWIKIEQYVW